ncbi:MAG: hypothetical protein ABIG68_03970 [Acidobacteriota bacterium]
MTVHFGIRREDKNKWERRVPLIPSDIAGLRERYGQRFTVQPSAIRVYPDDEYRSAGAEVREDLGDAKIVLAVKEVPVPFIQPAKVYVFFAHVAKGQAYNMPMLRRLMELGCSVVDYEKITDDRKRRLIFFGRHAGYAGMVETLRALGRRLSWSGVETPLREIRHAFEYADLAEAKEHLRRLAVMAEKSPPAAPVIVGFSGYGNVSGGAQEVLECMSPRPVAVGELPRLAAGQKAGESWLAKVVFKEEDMVGPRDAAKPFVLQEYYDSPDRYAGCFEPHLAHLDVLVNAIYWEPRYPRLVTREWARRTYIPGANPRLKIIGDISCDIEGSIEMTVRITQPDNPCFVYFPLEGTTRDGVEGHGPVIMAVDNLPCEIPRESSQYFSSVLRNMVPPLAAADWEADFGSLDLPSHLKRALIVHKGELTPSYRYLHKHLEVRPDH